MHKLHFTRRQGFTLIELLIVIAIISIFSVIGFTSINSARERARDAKRKADINSVRTALNLYFDSYNSFPHQVTFAAFNNISTVGNVLYDTLVIGKVASSLPQPPLAGESYYYRSCDSSVGQDTNFTLYSNLEQPEVSGNVLVFNYARSLLAEVTTVGCPQP